MMSHCPLSLFRQKTAGLLPQSSRHASVVPIDSPPHEFLDPSAGPRPILSYVPGSTETLVVSDMNRGAGKQQHGNVELSELLNGVHEGRPPKPPVLDIQVDRRLEQDVEHGRVWAPRGPHQRRTAVYVPQVEEGVHHVVVWEVTSLSECFGSGNTIDGDTTSHPVLHCDVQKTAADAVSSLRGYQDLSSRTVVPLGQPFHCILELFEEGIVRGEIT
ncbi:hypothetical protein JX265_004324 [Neoarthrinium moseri]|uniref:Uncharacterized protein n=1 Tax=Neoarthrinium moseri TaxID=1658444 RepID=A0A9P9WQQ0_9PEZI|nr:hypothetical protein JX265_004324 [Neoarthrinium moseri]